MLAAGAAQAADDERDAPITLHADQLRSTPERETLAEGDVELRRGNTVIRADRLRYRPPSDIARAEGHVRIERDGAVYRGPAAELKVGDLEGWFLMPEFDFARLGTHGSAQRIDFQGRAKLNASAARYTSCPREGGDPDWVLEARQVALDFDANEGLADGARLRFLGTTILALPRLSFPVTEARKSGWLPPTLNIDSRSGVELSIPYYWNIAPHLDATIAPRVMTRRGVGALGEFRYLDARFRGEATLDWLPHDQVAGRSRHAAAWRHAQSLPGGIDLRIDALRVSDNDWWKDFPQGTNSLTPRLLPLAASAERRFAARGVEGLAYARVQQWQVLQSDDAPILSPYARSPQIGLRLGGMAGRFEFEARTELNHFVLPDADPSATRPEGWRWHAEGAVAMPWRQPSWWVIPRLRLNAARYRTDAPMADRQRGASRLIPTFSLDAGLELERQTQVIFGRNLRQTLEPRLLYVRTPYRRQDQLPNFDAFGKEFNFSSLYSENAFSGIDRVSDAHQLTAGVTSRLLDPDDGAELLRVGVAQRYLFRDQRVAPRLDGAVDGAPLQQRFSDVLLLASTTLLPNWSLDAALQYSSDNSRLRRSIVGATWTPGPFRTLNARYRLARNLSEQLEFGWQWPVYRGAERNGSGCSGTLYGVGRVNFSLRDSRVTDSILGVEYDAGCWIGRVLAERRSTGRTEASTRLLIQLELVGLSRLGSNPLKILKDNIPGYRLLRDERVDSHNPGHP